MIKVNTQTLNAIREQIPANLKGLSIDTLTNLQTELNPVPVELVNVEYWPSVLTTQTITASQKLGDEILTAIAADKVVEVSYYAVDKTAEEIQAEALIVQKEVEEQTQKRLDSFARTKSYDSILSACTYATSAVDRLKDEGQYCVIARDNTWNTLYTILADVIAGTRPMPSGYGEIEDLLPVLAWPV